mmetsp:Transcript_15819/g.21408  ORF Transcript_15819/g.21408 Transcript_15819/m.21408 type:complete len:92 (-) Transcript_15819:49-324(-)
MATDCVTERIKLFKRGECKHMYELIFTDFSMPGMCGPDLTKILRLLYESEDIAQPYICCISAYDDETFTESAYMAGADLFMVKPAKADQIY